MDPRTRGDAAEAVVLAALAEAGLAVWLPWSRSGPCDLLVESPAGRVVRVQVKCGRYRDGCVLSNSRSTDHGSGRRSYLGVVDVIAVHVPELRKQFVVPVELVQGFEVRLRVDPTRNGQVRRVRHARDHRLEDWARALLEERAA